MATTFSRNSASVHVRPFSDGDAPAFLEAVRESIDSLSHWFPTRFHHAFGAYEAEQWVTEAAERWELGTDYRFGVFDSASNRLLGCVGINNVNRTYGFGNLGYWIRSTSRDRGIASDAVRLVAQIGLSALDFVRLEIFALPSNLPSIRVAEKIGAVREGVARNRLIYQEQPADAIAFSLIRSDMPED
jgi:RimJ/RimL family protein N-acetyltransferase